MDEREMKDFMADISVVMKSLVAGALAPVVSRLEEIERRLDAAPSQEAASLEDVRALVREAVAAIPTPADGKDGADGRSVTAEDIMPLISAEVAKAVAALPKPQDGADGKDADPAEIERLIDEKMAVAVAAMPAPKDGRDGADGRDGVGLAGAFLDRTGNLILTLTDGSTRDLGPVIGKDGRDGFSLEDFDVEKKDDRTVILKFARGDVAEHYELHFPVMIYRGVYREGEAYERGDTVTWGGSLWHCDQDTTDKPDGQQKHWTLAAKRGRDGKDGTVLAEKAPAPIKLGGGK